MTATATNSFLAIVRRKLHRTIGSYRVEEKVTKIHVKY